RPDIGRSDRRDGRRDGQGDADQARGHGGRGCRRGGVPVLRPRRIHHRPGSRGGWRTFPVAMAVIDRQSAGVPIAGGKLPEILLPTNCPGCGVGLAGERLARGMEQAASSGLPYVLVCASGGARMQEGVLALMQMAKVNAALGALHRARVPYFSVLTDPTFGGTAASLALLADINIAE